MWRYAHFYQLIDVGDWNQNNVITTFETMHLQAFVQNTRHTCFRNGNFVTKSLWFDQEGLPSWKMDI